MNTSTSGGEGGGGGSPSCHCIGPAAGQLRLLPGVSLLNQDLPGRHTSAAAESFSPPPRSKGQP